MSPARYPPISRLLHQAELMREILKGLDEETLADVLRIAGDSPRPLEEGPGTAVADGFPPRSSGMGDSAPGSSESTATERAALRNDRARADEDEPDRWVDPFDAVRALVDQFLAKMSEAHGVLRELDRARIHIDGHKKQIRGRVWSLQGDCMCCDRSIAGIPNDRRKAGFCSSKPNWCYQAWVRQGRPERSAFILKHKRWLKERDEKKAADA